MKVTTKHATNLIQGEVESVKMSLSEKGIIAATRMFRDQIYTYKEWAVVREIIANAKDEHKKHNVSRPVEITLPSATDPHFRVRDFAAGLSKDGVFNVFFQYFESTKDQDNDSIGGFGIGAKAPLAYSEMFFVDSYHNGQKTSYIANIDGEASTAHKMDLQDSSETGIEVSVPVESNDFVKFRDLAAIMIHNGGWTNQIKVLGYQGGTKKLLEENIQQEKEKFSSKFGQVGNVISKYDSGSKIFARIEGILYAIDSTSEIKSPFFNNCIINFSGNDEIEIHPSRERIELTKRNIVKVNKRLQELKDSAIESVKNSTAKAKTAREHFQNAADLSMFRADLPELVKHKPVKLDAHTFNVKVITWNSVDFNRMESSKMFRHNYGGGAMLSFKPSGLSCDPWYKNHNFIETGSIITIPSDKKVVTYEIIAFAEKNNIPSPVFVINKEAPDTWVKDSDYWHLDDNSVTKEETSAIRKSYTAPSTSNGNASRSSGLQDDTILGYSISRRCKYYATKWISVKRYIEDKTKIVVIPMDTKGATFASNYLSQLGFKYDHIVFAYKTHLKHWKKIKNHVLMDGKKIKSLCKAYVNKHPEIDDSKFKLPYVYVDGAKAKAKYSAKSGGDSRQVERLISRIQSLFPDIKRPKDNKLQKRWEKANERFQNLSKFDREMISLCDEWCIENKIEIKTKIREIKNKVFV